MNALTVRPVYGILRGGLCVRCESSARWYKRVRNDGDGDGWANYSGSAGRRGYALVKLR